MTLNPMNQKRLSPTSRIQSRPCLFNAPFQNPLKSRKILGIAADGLVCPQDLFPRSHRQPLQIGCLPQASAPKDRGLPSPHPSDPLRDDPKPVWRLFGAWIRTAQPAMAPAERLAAVALRLQNLTPREIYPRPA
jgi:hypothetical protein